MKNFYRFLIKINTATQATRDLIQRRSTAAGTPPTSATGRNSRRRCRRKIATRPFFENGLPSSNSNTLPLNNKLAQRRKIQGRRPRIQNIQNPIQLLNLSLNKISKETHKKSHGGMKEKENLGVLFIDPRTAQKDKMAKSTFYARDRLLTKSTRNRLFDKSRPNSTRDRHLAKVDQTQQGIDI